MLLAGPQGTGKRAFAEALAAALVCETTQGRGSACGACPACHWSGTDAHPDVKFVEPYAGTELKGENGETVEKDAKKHIAVDQVRALSDFIGMTSHRGGAKVVIVQPAEALNLAAANALLKSLEEPPPGTYFILVSHRPHLLLPTIKSRCQALALGLPQTAAALSWLKTREVEKPELALANAGGAPLLAAQWSTADYWQPRSAFLRLISQRDFDVLQVADTVKDMEPAYVLEWLQKWTYDLLCQKRVQRIRYNVDHAAAISEAAGRVDELSAARFHRMLVRTQRVIAHPLNARLLFEDLLGSYARVARGLSWR